MVSVEEVLAIHDLQIRRFGGLPGVRDRGILEAALASAWQSFAGVEFYPTDEEKAARLAFEVITQHPFADGNKRTGLVLMVSYLRSCGYGFCPDGEDLYRTICGVADGSIDYVGLVDFVRRNA